jgi:hypothetical protein
VEEEFWPLREVISKYSGKMTFALAEVTRQNLALVLNSGFGSSLLTTTEGSTAGSIWVEPPTAGSEVRVMLGWDAEIKGATSGTTPPMRIVIRQCLQTGQVKAMFRKGNNKTTWAAEFGLEKPATKQPFRVWTSVQMSS